MSSCSNSVVPTITTAVPFTFFLSETGREPARPPNVQGEVFWFKVFRNRIQVRRKIACLRLLKVCAFSDASVTKPDL